jgi:nitronate monooxygenase
MDKKSDLLSRLGLRWPVIQAPMAGVATPEMAAAVSRAGGLGSLGLGAADTGQARQMIRAARELGARPLNVNFFCHQPAQSDPETEAAWLDRLTPLFHQMGAEPPSRLREIYSSFIGNDPMTEMVLAERPEVVSFHFGLPSAEVLQALREAGVLLIASATSLAEGQAIQDAGLDGVIAQGIEAGGHRGIFDPDGPDDQLPCLALTRLLAGQLDLPVIAAGGIMTGGEIAAALEAGAALAQLGTAFISCPESQADAGYCAALTGAPGQNTLLTPAVSGRPARCVGNSLIDWIREQGDPELPDYPLVYDATKSLIAAAAKAGVPGYAAQWAGQGAPKSRNLPVADLMSELITEWQAAGS